MSATETVTSKIPKISGKTPGELTRPLLERMGLVKPKTSFWQKAAIAFACIAGFGMVLKSIFGGKFRPAG